MLHHDPDIALETHISQFLAHVQTLALGRPLIVVAVSKYTDVEKMKTAYQAGIRHFGESRVLDAVDKMAQFPAEDYQDLDWHFIGTVQSNKLAKSMDRFALVHSISTVRHAEALSSLAQERIATQKVLLQVNISQDPTRQGFEPETLQRDFDKLVALPGIQIQGLMAMAPPEISLGNSLDISNDPEKRSSELNRAFESVRLLRDKLSNQSGHPLQHLSMGMSRDYPEAIGQGATIIRIGTTLFNPPPTQQ